jgi:cytochrome c-type biogenesis protein CcmH/NrfG
MRTDIYMSASVLALLLLSHAAWPREAVSPAAGETPSAALKQDTARCSSLADVSACYNAIRWNPNDPALLAALGDALVRAQRLQDAVRNYRRAAVLAPGTNGLAAKISAAEMKLAAKQAPGKPLDRGSAGAVTAKRYSNAAPEAQSH